MQMNSRKSLKEEEGNRRTSTMKRMAKRNASEASSQISTNFVTSVTNFEDILETRSYREKCVKLALLSLILLNVAFSIVKLVLAIN